MDGFYDPGGIVRWLTAWDTAPLPSPTTASVRATREAMLATDDIHKTDPDFKLIYGCEAYFVDDMIPCVYGVKDQPLDGEFCRV